MEETEQLKLKKLFAARLMQINRENQQDVFKVACEFSPDMGQALRMATTWPQDPDVIEEIVRLNNEGFNIDEREKIKKELIDVLMKIVRDDKKFTEDRVKAAKEVAAISGITQENKTTINNNVQNNITSNKVMIVKDHGSDEDWERKLLIQQERLVHDATAATIH